jgi:hypothetical protein
MRLGDRLEPLADEERDQQGCDQEQHQGGVPGPFQIRRGEHVTAQGGAQQAQQSENRQDFHHRRQPPDIVGVGQRQAREHTPDQVPGETAGEEHERPEDEEVGQAER